jgi:anaerobic selenocysteine-containing dehydrogenase
VSDSDTRKEHDPSLPRAVAAQPPDALEPIAITAPKQSAAGPASVWSAARHSMDEMGLVRSVQALRRLNQQDGFDCPGCAWPDPDDRSPLGEFCENGARAVGEEATTKRVTPGFFRQWSVEELSRQTDHWLGKQGRITYPMMLRQGTQHYMPIAWDDAFRVIADALNALESPDEGTRSSASAKGRSRWMTSSGRTSSSLWARTRARTILGC